MPTKDVPQSPLRERALPQAGQSSDDRLQTLINEKLLTWTTASALFIVLAAFEWLRYYEHADPSPRTLSAIAFLGVAISAWKIRSVLRKSKRLKLGRDGERAVGECLQELVAKGWQVFHDIPGDKFNIDHVVIGRGGIFTVETKTRSKRRRKDATIVVDEGGCVFRPKLTADSV